MPCGVRLFLMCVSYACLLCVCFVGMYTHAHNVYIEMTGKHWKEDEKF